MTSKIYIAILIAGIFAASMFVRLWSANLPAPLSGDEPEYHELARNVKEGRGLINEKSVATAWRTPGYPAFLAIVYTVAGEQKETGRFMSILASALAGVGIFFLALLLFHKNFTAFVSAAIWTFLPTSIHLSGVLVGESLAALLVIGALLIVVWSERQSRFVVIGVIAGGLLIGAAVLTRGYLLPLLVVAPIYLALGKKRWKLAALCLMFSVLLPVAWMTRNAVQIGAFTLSTESAQVLWHGNNRWSRGTWNGEWFFSDSEQRAYLNEKYPGFFSDLTELERSRIYLEEAKSDIAADPIRILSLAPRKVAFLLNPLSYMGFDWLYVLCIPFALIGVWSILRNKFERSSLYLLTLPVVGVAMICVVTFGDPRFRHPVDFCFVILAAAGFTFLAERLGFLKQERVL